MRSPGTNAHTPTLRVAVGDGTTATIRVFPLDARFVRDIQRVLDGLAAASGSELGLRTQLESDLRAWYPKVQVRRRNDLADVEPYTRVWYVLRDGRVGRPRDRTERLHAAMSDARATSATTAAVLEQANRALARASMPRPGRGRAVDDGDSAGGDAA